MFKLDLWWLVLLGFFERVDLVKQMSMWKGIKGSWNGRE